MIERKRQRGKSRRKLIKLRIGQPTRSYSLSHSSARSSSFLGGGIGGVDGLDGAGERGAFPVAGGGFPDGRERSRALGRRGRSPLSSPAFSSRLIANGSTSSISGRAALGSGVYWISNRCFAKAISSPGCKYLSSIRSSFTLVPLRLRSVARQ